MMNEMKEGTEPADQKLPETVVELSVDGASYRMFLPDRSSDYIQKTIAETRQPYELEMLRNMADRLSRGGLVLDVGANVGNHSLYLAAVPGCRVIAYEPNAYLADAISESARLNGFEGNLIVRAVGVGAGPNIAHFAEETPSNLGGQHLALGEGGIEIVRLDSQNIDGKVEAIKIDVEGMEIDVLRGAEDLIERDKPIIYTECSTEAEFRQLMRVLHRHKYHYWDTFNATATHLFLPDALARGQDRIEHMKVREVLESYRSKRELLKLRTALNEANTKYRVASQRVSDLSRSLELATSIADTANAECSKWQTDAESARQELAAARDEIGRLRKDHSAELAGLRKQMGEPTGHGAHLQSEVSRLRGALTLSERKLRQAQGQNIQLQTQLVALVGSRTYRAGEALRDGSQSLTGLVAMPRRLMRAFRARPEPNSPAIGRAPASVALPQTLPAAGTPAQPAPPDPAPVVTTPLFRDGYTPPRELTAREGAPTVADLMPAPRRKLRVAAIMDGFTLTCYAPEAELLELTADNWKEEIATFRPDFLFVESAWRGKNNSWDRKIGHRSQELHELIEWCRQNNVLTAFWNKEDPVHYTTFLSTAKLFDRVFTTDVDCIRLYRCALGHDRVWLLPFSCQPRIHNPVELFARKDAINFAGAYYTRYPERTRDLENFTIGLPTLKPLDIFDRNYGKDDPNYTFPDSFQTFIVGTLPPDRIDIAYKGYRYAINLNSIKQSQSMFARRVQELLASNTLTVSNYSRGLRLMFGDLVISSDDCGEILRRFRDLAENELDAAKLRLAALRKVMSEHTSADRIDYIASKVFPERTVRSGLPEVTVVCRPADQAAAQRLLTQFAAQSLPRIRMLMQRPEGFDDAVPENVSFLDRESAARFDLGSLPSGSWIACWDGRDHYGPNYLYDLVLATRYSDAEVIGKAAHYHDGGSLLDADATYVPVARLARRRSIVRSEQMGATNLPELFDRVGEGLWQGKSLAVDPFNYCADAAAFDVIGGIVDDLPNLDTGLPLPKLLERAEGIEPAVPPQKIRGFDATNLANMFRDQGGKNVKVLMAGGKLEVMSDLPDGHHQYIYSKADVSMRNLLNDDGKLRCYADATPGLNLSLVVRWLNSAGERIGHEILSPLKNETVVPPKDAMKARLGLRALGRGTCEIRGIELTHRDMRPGAILGRRRVLLLTNHYPSYEDLYRNGFVHSRVRAYRELGGITPDVYRLRPQQGLSWHEFENVDCMTGSAEHLDTLLASGQYDHVLVHFLDKEMWQVLERYIDRVRVTVWVHGAEVQPWWRRTFNYSTDEELEKAKAASEPRLAFWRSLFTPLPKNLRFVFVSRYFAEEVFQDLDVTCPKDQYEIIHNPIDDHLFAYREKPAHQRGKILSIRPFASAKYANDLSVKAILALQREEFFEDLEFRIVGDGRQFEEITAPLAGLPNVVCEKRFLTQIEIAALHKEYGVCLSPTRMDAQGVSRDEAMSSGLVPVTSRVAAIPEFVDESCGYLADPEDAEGLAHAIAELWNNPETFLRKSRAAAERVRLQSGKDKVIAAELAAIEGREGGRGAGR